MLVSFKRFLSLIVLLLLINNAYSSAKISEADELKQLINQLCSSFQSSSEFDPSPVGWMIIDTRSVRGPGGIPGKISWIKNNAGARIKVFRSNINGFPKEIVIEAFLSGETQSIPNVGLRMDKDCNILNGKWVRYASDGRPQGVFDISRNLEIIEGRMGIVDPDVPNGRARGGVKVALIDSGINYMLPQFSGSLARTEKGQLIGFDYGNNDPRPYDEDFLLGSIWNPARHGTSVASVMLHDNPNVLIAPFRHPGVNSSRYEELFDYISKQDIKIVNLSLGGKHEKGWDSFQNAVNMHPEILVIIAAGNQGYDLDKGEPLYPAFYKLPNVLVVGSLDITLNISKLSNWGAETVDLAVIADPVNGFGFDGRPAMLRGSSFAAPRISALASKILALNPHFKGQELKTEIIRMAKPIALGKKTKYGWIDIDGSR